MTETVFISGADKGLRFSLATRFLHEEFRVFAGAYATSFVDSVRQAVRHVAERASALEVLINNAGVHIEDQDTPPEDLDLTDMHLERTMDVNAFGPLRTTQQFYPLLERGEHKLIIDISSEAGSIGGCWRSREFAYCMSKAALNMQSRLLQNYLGPRGFKVLAVHPGWMRTDMGGPDADLHPDQSAEAIFKLATKEWAPGDAVYVDYQGNALNW